MSYPWEGKRTERWEMRLTPAEKQELIEVCRHHGGISITRYLMNLHHKSMGRLSELAREQKNDR